MKKGSGSVFFTVFLSALLTVACGKKGDPLPPLVKLPVAPPDIAAERRGSTVDVTLTVPAVNTDGSRPANVTRVDIYALTGSPSATAAAVLKSGTKIASVQVKAPRDPNQTVDADDPDSDVDPPEGPGLDQGAKTTVNEEIGPSALRPPATPKPGRAVKDARAGHAPLIGSPPVASARVYAAVGVNRKGHPGPVSKGVAVPLIAPPAAPPEPVVTYNETTITLTWGAQAVTHAAPGGLLASTPLAAPTVTMAYNVYEVAPQTSLTTVTKLTSSPLTEPRYEDKRIEWGVERCYAIRNVEVTDRLAVEGDAGPSRCVTFADTFPPAAPAGLEAIALAGSISLLWDPNSEPDLAGYLVLRRGTPDGPFTKLTAEPIQAASYRDAVSSNVPYTYAVEAIDKTGNVSPMSATVEETAR